MRMSMRKAVVIALTLVLALGSVVVYGDKPNSSSECDEEHCHGNGGNGPPAGHDIEAKNFEFVPEEFPDLTHPFHDPVIWLALEGRHTVTICPKGIDLDLTSRSAPRCGGGATTITPIHDKVIKSGETTSFSFGASGTYNYFCRFHGKSKKMAAIVNVP